MFPHDAGCAVDGSICSYPDAPCECTTCTWRGGPVVLSCNAPETWSCLMPDPANDSRCQVLAPNLGTPCAPEGLSCTYAICGPDALYVCKGGLWTPMSGGFCPL